MIIRQVNFWLPHRTHGNKYLVLLSREASLELAAMVDSTHRPPDSSEHPNSAPSSALDQGSVAILKANGNRWLTRRGLLHVAECLGPDHVNLINKPLIFVSANAKDRRMRCTIAVLW